MCNDESTKSRRQVSTPSSSAEAEAEALLPERYRGLAVPGDGSVEVTFDFHRLTILLLRTTLPVAKDEAPVGRKVATLTITDARINASLSSDVVVQGSLGGLQVLEIAFELSTKSPVFHDWNLFYLVDLECSCSLVGDHFQMAEESSSSVGIVSNRFLEGFFGARSRCWT